jgi:hypothetical protein
LSQYYFLVSSLPYLQKDVNVQLSVKDFESLCREQMSDRDFLIIEKCKLDNFNNEESVNKTFSKWQVHEISLRNELLKLRAQKKGVQAEKYSVSGETVTGVDETARNAFNQSSPLDAESILDNARWGYLETLEVGNYFNIEKLILYSLKLQLLEKKASFDIEKGTEVFNNIIEEKLEKIKSGENVYD